jgi:hypothetical protein
MQPRSARADAGTMVRLFALVVGSALLLSGCSSAEGQRAQELLQQAELAQAQLRSATFEANLGVVMDGKQVKVTIEGAASKQGAAISVRTSGIPNAGKNMELVVRGDRAWTVDGSGNWTPVPVPKELNGKSGSMGADAFQELARYVKDVRVSEHQQIGSKLVTTIAGEIDTVAMLKAASKLGSLSGASGDKAGGFSLDLDDLGIEVGDIKAVLSIDERTHLLDSALITVAVEARGETLELNLQYRLESANEPVTLPSPSG